MRLSRRALETKLLPLPAQESYAGESWVGLWQAEEAVAAGQLAVQVRYVLLQQHTVTHIL